MSRVTLAAVVLAVALPQAAMATRVGGAEQAGDRVADLADRLATGLRVRAPGDVAFCERVATLVREGRLPAELVDATYVWAVGRGRKHPFPAFQHVMRIKAAKLGAPL